MGPPIDRAPRRVGAPDAPDAQYAQYAPYAPYAPALRPDMHHTHQKPP
jgi:hypothetical protein